MVRRAVLGALTATILSVAVPAVADDPNWLVGQWEGPVKSDIGKHKDWVRGKGCKTIEVGLNGQFLISKGHAEGIQLSEDYLKYLKETKHASQQEIDNIQNTVFEDLEVFTTDPKTGEIIGYLFDSLHCVAQGRGKRQGNKETIAWQWSAAGQGTSIRITEKTGTDTMVITETYTMPDGSIMIDKAQMTRTNTSAH